MIGQKLGSFRIESVLGVGGMGKVYKAVHEPTGKVAAVKVIHNDVGQKGIGFARFQREAEILKQFRHPNIVRLLALGRYQGTPYFAMEYVDGRTLEQVLRERGSIPWKEAVDIAIQLCDALHYAHEHGIVHRDLKPSNLMLTEDGKVKLTDFGIAKDLEMPALVGTGRIGIGTAAYMSPEQIDHMRTVSPKSDLYALGAVLYHMLAGRPPFEGPKAIGIMYCHINEPPPRPGATVDGIPGALDEIVIRLMAKTPDDRVQDAFAVTQTLVAIRDNPLPALTEPLQGSSPLPAPADTESGGTTSTWRTLPLAAGGSTRRFWHWLVRHLKPSRTPKSTSTGPDPTPRSPDDATVSPIMSTVPLSRRRRCPKCLKPPAQDAGGVTASSAVALCPDCQVELQAARRPDHGYRIVKEIGRGGMGVVYLAVRASDNSCFAVKMIEPGVHGSRREVERFFREARILEQLNHPNIVAYREMGDWDGRIYFAMDFVDGVDLSKLHKGQGGPLPIARAVDITCQVLDALDYAHAKRFVHRDIKPSNILVTIEGGHDRVKVADFGLARIYQASTLSGVTGPEDLGGTVAFMAPEQFTQFRDVGPSADQYSTGATLYKLLTGRFVYGDARDQFTQLSHIAKQPPMSVATFRQDVPAGLAEVVQRSLAKDPADRFRDVAQMRRAMESFRR
jgi:serine/threonine protein kinase